MKPLNIKLDNFKEVDLMKEYNKARKDHVFDKIVSKLNLSDDELCNYTSMLETSASEYKNCMECHIEDDFLLIWKDPEQKVIRLLRLGSHSKLFDKQRRR